MVILWRILTKKTMTDVHSKETRSYNMSKIKGKDTKPEILVRKFLFSQGLRYKLHDKTLPGKPDIVFPKYKAVVFVHGCFWHGHKDCKYFTLPKTRTKWWLEKINRNISRDKTSLADIKKQGWLPIVVWECQLKPDKREKTLNTIIKTIMKNEHA